MKSTRTDTPSRPYQVRSPKKRGFAALTPERQRELASMGGKAAHAQGTGHKFSAEEAQVAGRAGGQRVSADRKHMAEIGRMGGLRGAQKKNTPTALATPPPPLTPPVVEESTLPEAGPDA